MKNGRSSQEIASCRYKPWLDITVLLLAHVSLLPLFALLWTTIPVLILLEDRGPVFYKQRRVGIHGRIFSVLKFRTMVKDAESKGPAWTTEGDPRITRVGKLLRRTALDELPEVLNIIKRDMSFVGPRALDVEEQRSLERVIPGFARRLEVLPGLTGLAQIYDPTDNARDKLRFDSEYLRIMSPWLDIKILILSVRNTLIAKWDQRLGKPATNYHGHRSSQPTDQQHEAPDANCAKPRCNR